jgi:hypothetical protein
MTSGKRVAIARSDHCLGEPFTQEPNRYMPVDTLPAITSTISAIWHCLDHDWIRQDIFMPDRVSQPGDVSSAAAGPGAWTLFTQFGDAVGITVIVLTTVAALMGGALGQVFDAALYRFTADGVVAAPVRSSAIRPVPEPAERNYMLVGRGHGRADSGSKVTRVRWVRGGLLSPLAIGSTRPARGRRSAL